jgi:1,2-diacylglycerol 3-alpha-glucosyltransferase
LEHPDDHAAVNPEKPRVAVIFHRLGPYHVARLRAAAHSFEVIAIEQSAETAEYGWRKVATPESVARITLSANDCGHRRKAESIDQITKALDSIAALRAVAIPGWSNLTALAALRWCIEQNLPCIVMTESGASDKSRSRLSEWVKTTVLTLCSAALAGGSRHRDYLLELGLDQDRIFLGYDAVDNDYFRQKAEEVRGQRPEVRKEYGLPGNYFLASARFLPRKNLVTLLRAYADYVRRSSAPGWDLVLLGDGPLRSQLVAECERLRIAEKVHLRGFVQYDELPMYYGLAGAFVHASISEPWGLVVNEAMASGLPLVVSKKCGCIPELLEEGRNGFSFSPENGDELAALLLRMAAFSDAERELMGRRSRRIVDSWSVERFASGLRDAVTTAECAPRKSNLTMAKFLLSGLILARTVMPNWFKRASSRNA